MPLRDAILVLRERLKVLRARLGQLTEPGPDRRPAGPWPADRRRGTQRPGPDACHKVVEKADASVVEARSWAKQMARAVARAARKRAGLAAVRVALTDAQLALDRLRENEPCYLLGEELRADLRSLVVRFVRNPRNLPLEPGQVELGGWAKRSRPEVEKACAAYRAVEAAMAACWRELANHPARPVKVKTVTVVE